MVTKKLVVLMLAGAVLVAGVWGRHALAESDRLLDGFEVNQWKSTKANCRVALELSSEVRRSGEHSLSFHKAENVIHNGWISRPVEFPPGTRGVTFWVMKGQDRAPRLGIGLNDGETHFAFDTKGLSAALAPVPKGEWKQVEVHLDTDKMTAWPRGREKGFDLAKIKSLILAVGDNRTRTQLGWVLYIDDMELLLPK